MTLWEMGAGSVHLLEGLQWPLQHGLGCTECWEYGGSPGGASGFLKQFAVCRSFPDLSHSQGKGLSFTQQSQSQGITVRLVLDYLWPSCQTSAEALPAASSACLPERAKGNHMNRLSLRRG